MSPSSEPVSAEEWAALEFEPQGPFDQEPPSNEEWAALANPYLVSIRLAWLSVQKTKAELMQVVRDLEDEPAIEMLEGFISTAAFFETHLQLLRSAETRILSAASAVELERAA